MREIKVTDNDGNQRIDRFLAKYMEKAPKSLIQKYIRTKKVKINKKRAKADDIIKTGDIINLYIYNEVIDSYQTKESFNLSDKSLDYIYNDNHISIIYKAEGVLMHGAKDSLRDIYLSDLIKAKEFNPIIENSFTPSFANRLDRNTSGILVACKNAESLRIMNKVFRNRNVRRIYRMLVNGLINDTRVVDLPLAKIGKEKVVVSENGLDAKSIFKPLQIGKNYSLVEGELISGRKHQLRVHSSYIGHPIVGDLKYGYGEDLKDFGVFGQYLISNQLCFNDVDGHLSYLSNKCFSLPDKYFNKDLEDYYLSK